MILLKGSNRSFDLAKTHLQVTRGRSVYLVLIFNSCFNITMRNQVYCSSGYCYTPTSWQTHQEIDLWAAETSWRVSSYRFVFNHPAATLTVTKDMGQANESCEDQMVNSVNEHIKCSKLFPALNAVCSSRTVQYIVNLERNLPMPPFLDSCGQKPSFYY